MNISDSFLDSTVFQWVILPGLIFLARITDMSLDTLRILFMSKGYKRIVPILGFIQVLIWLVAIRQIILNISNIACYVAFAGGVAGGAYIGMVIEEKLAYGMQVVRVITKKEGMALVDLLKANGFGVTYVDAKGATGEVNIIFTIVRRKDIAQIISLVKKVNPKAFYSVEDVNAVSEGVFPGMDLEDARKLR